MAATESYAVPHLSTCTPEIVPQMRASGCLGQPGEKSEVGSERKNLVISLSAHKLLSDARHEAISFKLVHNEAITTSSVLGQRNRVWVL